MSTTATAADTSPLSAAVPSAPSLHTVLAKSLWLLSEGCSLLATSFMLLMGSVALELMSPLIVRSVWKATRDLNAFQYGLIHGMQQGLNVMIPRGTTVSIGLTHMGRIYLYRIPYVLASLFYSYALTVFLLASPLMGIFCAAVLYVIIHDVQAPPNIPTGTTFPAGTGGAGGNDTPPRFNPVTVSVEVTAGASDPISLEPWSLGQRVSVLNASPHHLVSETDSLRIIGTRIVPTSGERIVSYQPGIITSVSAETPALHNSASLDLDSAVASSSPSPSPGPSPLHHASPVQELSGGNVNDVHTESDEDHE